MTATQAPTPGPLSEPVKGAANGLCNRSACQAPLAGEPLHQFMQGNFTGGPRLHYCEKCAKDFDKWDAIDMKDGEPRRITREPKSLAPTAPVEASGSEREAIVEAIKVAMKDAWEDHASDTGCWPADIKRVSARGPLRLMFTPAIWAQTTAEWAAETILRNRPQPSGETREAVLLKQLREAVRDYWQGRGAQAAGGYAKWAAVCDALQAYDREALSTTPARAEAQDEGAAGEPVAWLWEQWSSLTGVWSDRMTFDKPGEHKNIRKVQPLYAHPSPTPADDADRVRVAVEALEPFAHIASHVGLPKDDTVHVTALDGQWIATVRREDFWNARQALAALKSEGK